MARSRPKTRRQARSNPRGALHVSSSGYGFVQTAEGEYFVPSSKMGGAFDGDIVELAPISASKKQGQKPQGKVGEKPTARVLRVINRAHDVVIGRYEVAEPFGVVVPEDHRIPYDIFTMRAENPDVGDGDIVRVRIKDYPTRNTAATGIIEAVVGRAGDADLPIDMIIANHHLETEFSEAALEQASQAELNVDTLLGKGYRDLRYRFVFTIDPADARDFDDAISLEKVEGLWRLGVHIADVSAYVPWNSPLDHDARIRATSVYLVDRVLPMLPEALSAELCSLKPGQDRASMTVDLYLDSNQQVKRYDIFPALINSNRRLSYDEAQAFLDDVHAAERRAEAAPQGSGGCDAETAQQDCTEEPINAGKQADADVRQAASFERAEDAAAVQAASSDGMENAPVAQVTTSYGMEDAPVVQADAHDEVVSRLVQLDVIARGLAARRERAGGIDFDTVEAKAVLDEDGVPIDIKIRGRSAATALIEEAMILANNTVAEHLHKLEFPCMYRVHEAPSADSLAELVPVLYEFGYFSELSTADFVAGDPFSIQKLLALSKGRPEHELVSSLVLRAMKRAVYKPECEIHYGLASKAYAHFTSPIRRYPDLIVHRMLKAQLYGRSESFEGQVSMLPWLGEHCSAMERVAEAAGRESQEYKIIEFLQDKIGCTFEAVISGVANYGIFVKLENTAEGLVGIRSLGNEYFALDPTRHMLTGDESGKIYRLGQKVSVVLESANPRQRKLDFRLHTSNN